MGDDGTTLAIDLGGTRIKAGIVEANTVVESAMMPTDDDKGFDHVLQHLIAVGERLARDREIRAVGLSVPGIVDVERGVVMDINKKLVGMIGFPLAATLEQHFGCTVALENDARLHGLGELVAGAAQGVENLVCLTFGTGVGCCVVIDGRILRGPRGMRGILGGHMTIESDGPICTCGSVGCFEALCRASALVHEATRRLPARPDHPFHTVDALTPEDVVSAAAAGDPLAGAALSAYLRHLAVGVVSYINLHDPDLVLLGGGVMNAAESMLPYVQDFARERAWTIPRGRVAIRACALGDNAALIGAAALARGEARFL
jgi:glucokinase